MVVQYVLLMILTAYEREKEISESPPFVLSQLSYIIINTRWKE